jgi:hypothetical protein
MPSHFFSSRIRRDAMFDDGLAQLAMQPEVSDYWPAMANYRREMLKYL